MQFVPTSRWRVIEDLRQTWSAPKLVLRFGLHMLESVEVSALERLEKGGTRTLAPAARWVARTLLSFVLLLATASAHRASGIVVDDHGNIFFIDSRHALYRIDTQHVTTVVKSVSDGHWLTIDRLGRFANSNPRYFERVTPPGALPALIFAGGGAPITVAHDGALYYGSGESNGDSMFPGGLELSRIEPDGRQSKVSDELKRILALWDDGITALATGPGDSVYVERGPDC